MKKKVLIHAYEKQIGNHRSNEDRHLPTYSRNTTKIYTPITWMREKTSRTAKQDLKTLVTMLTMILRTMSKTDTSHNSPEKN